MNFVSTEHKGMSIKKQCSLLAVPRSSYYRPSADPARTDETLMRAIDRIATEEPTFGVKRMVDALETRGFGDKHHRVRRIMREMGLEPIYPKPRLSNPPKGIRSIHTCFASWQSAAAIRSGAPTLLTSLWRARMFICARSWTGTRDALSAGA